MSFNKLKRYPGRVLKSENKNVLLPLAYKTVCLYLLSFELYKTTKRTMESNTCSYKPLHKLVAVNYDHRVWFLFSLVCLVFQISPKCTKNAHYYIISHPAHAP